MKKIIVILLSVLCIAMLLSSTSCSKDDMPTLVDNIDADSIKEHRAGEQIELYISSPNYKALLDHIDPEASQVAIADTEILEIRGDGYLIPKSVGITYISCKYDDIVKNYNVIVHKGAEYVTSCKISDSTSSAFNASVGQVYKIEATNSSNCPFSELRVDAYTDYSEVGADELVSISSNGELRAIGVGECEIWIHSATNANDKGVRIAISSDFAEGAFSDAVTQWVENNLEQTQKGVITKSELSEIKDLTFNNLVEFDDGEWAHVLPSLSSVTYDISDGGEYGASFRIGSGSVSYSFIGNKDKTYGFSISAKKRDRLDLTFTDMIFNSNGIDVTEVKDTSVSCYGKFEIKGIEGKNNGNGCNGIGANNLLLTIGQSAKVTISAGNGTSYSTAGTRYGGAGIRALGKLEIVSESSLDDATLKIYGGNGGNGYSSGNSGGAGGVGISAGLLKITGLLSCYIYGGNGGNGFDGRSYESEPASSGATGSPGVDGGDGKTGANGQNGGSGGNGAFAISSGSIEKAERINLILVGGNGGNGAKGGCGQTGGNGGKGGNTCGNNNDDDAGNGGDGGDGGDGGNGGDAGNGSLAIQITNTDDLSKLLNTTMTHGYGGNAGSGGNGGNGGNGGSGGDDKHVGNIFIFGGEGPIHGSGGAAGNAGVAGKAGKAASQVKLLDLSNITESIAKKVGSSQAIDGKNGVAGTKGSKGDPGAWG